MAAIPRLHAIAILGALLGACSNEPPASYDITSDEEPASIAVSGAPAAVQVAVPPAAGAPAAVEVVAGQPTVAVEAEVAPLHGGTVVLAGTHHVEVVPHASGEVYAYAVGAPPSVDATLSVVVPISGGVRTVELAWDAHHHRWGGVVGVAIVPGPIEVAVVVGTHRWVGHSTTVIIAPAIQVAVVSPRVHVDNGLHLGHFRGRGHGRGHGHGHGHGHGGASINIHIH